MDKNTSVDSISIKNLDASNNAEEIFK